MKAKNLNIYMHAIDRINQTESVVLLIGLVDIFSFVLVKRRIRKYPKQMFDQMLEQPTDCNSSSLLQFVKK